MEWSKGSRELILRYARSFITTVEPRRDEQLSPWLHPGIWFWLVLLVGLAIRAYLVVFTQGTYDVEIWQGHATGVAERGLIAYYHSDVYMNHPPFISIMFSLLWRFAQFTGIDFRIFLRAPFAITEIGTAALMLVILRQSRYRFLTVACYWLYPLTMIFSSYHGNTDSVLPLFIMLSIWLLSKERIIWAGALLGVSLWIKLPPLLTVPAFLFCLPRWRSRLKFLLAIGIVGGATYLPAMLKDPGIVFNNVFLYRGRVIQAVGDLIWGISVFIPDYRSVSPEWQQRLRLPLWFYLTYDRTICIGLILLWSWLRRSRRTIRDMSLSVVGVYAILYAFTNRLAFQYFAWSIPFWFLAPLPFSVPAAALVAAYIYGVYWQACENPWLLHEWDLLSHPYSRVVKLFRNVSVLFFVVSALVFLIGGICSEVSCWYRWMLARFTGGIRIKCPHCGKLLAVGEEHAGRKAKCSKCGNDFTVPESECAFQTSHRHCKP